MTPSDELDAFCDQLRRRHVEGPLPTAKRTAYLMRLLTTTRRHNDAQALLDDVRLWGTKMQSAKPFELAIGNITRRVLHMIREEAQQELDKSADIQPDHISEHTGKSKRQGLLSKALQHPGVSAVRAVSLHNLLDQPLPFFASSSTPSALSDSLAAAGRQSNGRSEPQTPTITEGKEFSPEVPAEPGKKRKGSRGVWQGKNAVIEQLNELIDELDEIALNIAQQAVEHIHANEVILTQGMSETTLLFLKEAAKKRSFQVIVAEGAPGYGGHRMAAELARAGLHTTAIADSAIFALMARVNKVILGARALLANGGIMSDVGSHVVALAAKRHAVPLVVLVGLYKLSPLFPHDPIVTFNDFKSSADVIDYEVLAEPLHGADGRLPALQEEEDESPASRPAADLSAYVHAPNPAFDYVPPELISLFVTDTGGYTPSYVYRLLAEYFTREDYGLSKELLDALIR